MNTPEFPAGGGALPPSTPTPTPTPEPTPEPDDDVVVFGDLIIGVAFSEEGFDGWSLRDRFFVRVVLTVENTSATNTYNVDAILNLPDNVFLRRREHIAALGEIAPGDETSTAFEIYLFRSFTERTIDLSFDIEAQGYLINIPLTRLIPANVRGMRLSGQDFAFDTIVPVTRQPIINEIVVEPIDGLPGAYVIRVTDFYTFSDRTPYFFWRTAEGTLLQSSHNADTVEFRADPGTGGRRVPIVVSLGDLEGSVVRVWIWVEGRH